VRRVRVFAVDAAGNDLLGRAVPEGALSRARELAAESGHPRAAQVVAAPGGESYLLFVPHTALAPPPPPLPVSPWMLIVTGAATLERIEREATRLSELVGEVLTLARLESVNPAAEPVELADVVASVAEDARFEAQAAGRDVSFHGVGGAIVRGRAELLHRAVENVVRNAVKYTAPGSTVDIAMRLEVNPPRAVVSVTDCGPGIAPEELGRIFEPFYRGGSDASGTQGFGLGLA